MEPLGAVAAVLQLTGVVMQGLKTVNDVYQGFKNQDQTLKELYEEIQQMRLHLISFENIVLKASNSGVPLPDGMSLDDVRATLSNAKKTLQILRYIFDYIKNTAERGGGRIKARLRVGLAWEKSAPTIEHLRKRMSTFATMMQTPTILLGIELNEYRMNSYKDQGEVLTDHVLNLEDRIDELRRDAEDIQIRPNDFNLPWVDGQQAMTTMQDSKELACLAGKVLSSATTVGKSLDSEPELNSRKQNRDTRYQDHDGHQGSPNSNSHSSSVYNSVLKATATMSLIGVPLSSRQKDNIFNWRDNVIAEESDAGNPSVLNSGSTKGHRQILTAQPSGPCNEPNTVSEAAAHLITLDLEDLCSRVAVVFMKRMGNNKALQWIRDMRQQLLQSGHLDIAKSSANKDARLVLQAIFRTNPESTNKPNSNPFVSSPSLMDVRFNEGKKLYERGNLITAAPLLILFARDQRSRNEISGAYKGISHACRPETDRSLLCGKLLCQMDPFSYYGPRSLVCSRCKGKSAWPYLPMLFAHLALHKYSRGAIRLPRGFQHHAELAISECYSVLGHLAEDKLGTLAVASAVMQFMRERNATFCINNAPLGLDMTWAGSLPYFMSQQELMLDLAKTCPKRSADVGEKLLKQHYRRIDFFHELDDRTDPPALYERIHEMLIKNGGKLWRRQEDLPRNNTQTRFPVLELLVTSTPRLQWGVFGAADEIEYLMERILSEDSSFGWDLDELSCLIRMAILAGNPMAVSILIWSQRESNTGPIFTF
ncbi:hypothetical protein NOF04DRAFT_20673 [Fusarium oxysporum II5]|uniref:Fungal N-terminal domain-containing protein n=1 Tax=Fusarium odoratissimum (strain NRRL 54006) TaxID=1089451 RepID=X0INK1_FUSO5|nr:uncharacterized protein FOIG_16359 [Fusarium odoratissimum NRRL 54006]EXL90422.1 hypothetical protein FOIG_16359 [Fusarium odoratissimum NRRL 54006]KAK2133347.1 hypothetical protein NOF04DRAFT_20673 [Fusarium oxysporum II5]